MSDCRTIPTFVARILQTARDSGVTFLDSVPLVAITGQGGLTRLHHGSHQYLDIVNMLKPITKIIAVKNEKEAITVANDSIFGLGA